jgi:RIO kinase 1
MEYLGEAETPAPTLHEISLDRFEARPLFDRLLANVALLLAEGCIHGDLSAFNVLYWQGQVRLIDFPQVVSPAGNPEARPIFDRDVARLCQYFARQGVRANPARLAAELWDRHGPPLAEPEPPEEELPLDD